MDAPWTAGPVLSLALLLGAAGVVKLGTPASAIRAIAAAKFPAPEIGVRVLGLGELLLAVAVVTVGSAATTAALAVAYLGFAAFAARLLVVQGATVPCGCFGEASAPTSRLHVVVNVIAAAVAGAAVAWPPGAITDVLSSQPAWGIPLLVLAGAGAMGIWAALVLVPEVADAAATVRADRERSTSPNPAPNANRTRGADPGRARPRAGAGA